MPATRQTGEELAEPDPHVRPSPPGSDPGDAVLAAERAHLRASREFLHLMRQNALSLRALGGDRVSEEYLKADLYRRRRRSRTFRAPRCSSAGSTTLARPPSISTSAVATSMTGRAIRR